MICMLCNQDYPIKEMQFDLICNSCHNHADSLRPKERSKFEAKLIKKKRDIRKYQKKNKTIQTKAAKKAKKIMRKILEPHEIKFTEERVFFPYIVDFYIRNIRVAIEIDGSIHDSKIEYDDRRDRWLKEKYAVTVIRFNNEEVWNDRFTETIWWLADKYLTKRIFKINKFRGEKGVKLYNYTA